jgi:hypothetical protein
MTKMKVEADSMKHLYSQNPFSPSNSILINVVPNDSLIGYFIANKNTPIYKVYLKSIKRKGTISIQLFDLQKNIGHLKEYHYYFFRGDSVILKGSR